MWNYGFGAGSASGGMSERKGEWEDHVPLVPFLCSAVKGIFVPELELANTRDALKRGGIAISRGDGM